MLRVAVLLLLCCAATTAAPPAKKRVMVWTTVSTTAGTNATARAEFLAELARVKDVVDVVAPCSYFVQQVPPHGLLKQAGADVVHQSLKDAGFKVQPLVGDIGGGWNMSWYRCRVAVAQRVGALVQAQVALSPLRVATAGLSTRCRVGNWAWLGCRAARQVPRHVCGQGLQRHRREGDS